MSGGLSSSLMQRLMDAGIDGPQMLMVAEAIESRDEMVTVFKDLIERLTGTGASSKAIGAALYEVSQCFADRHRPATGGRAAAVACGPKERWNYDGPITPRLPEREWWPLRNSVIREAEWTCHYCQDSHDNMCADHVVPLSRGGTNDRSNLVCCCIPCNSSKADRLLSEWRGRYR